MLNRAWITLFTLCASSKKKGLALLLLLLINLPFAQAHAPRENYVWVNIETDYVNGRFEVNVNDLKSKLGIDVDVQGDSRLEGVKATASKVQSYLLENFTLSYNGEQKDIEFLEPSVFNDTGRFVQYHFRTEGVPLDDRMTITNTIFLTEQFLDDDPLHRSLVLLDYNKFRDIDFGKESTALVFGPHITSAELNTLNPPKILIWEDFLNQGLLHIWAGLDHMLFLFVLLLTAVLVRSNSSWQPVTRARDAFFNTLKIITVFTVSHSITLALAVLGLVDVPAAPVEAIIALSIIVVALNNVYPLIKTHTWVLIFVFGLIHGLGFASALGELQFRNVKIEKVLLMFNIGVELGQIAVVCVVLPVFFLLRKTPVYRKLLMPVLSLAAAVMASYWLATRMGWLA